jgi:hypothetical protein
MSACRCGAAAIAVPYSNVDCRLPFAATVSVWHPLAP